MKITRRGRELIKKAVSEMNEQTNMLDPAKITVLEFARAVQVPEIQSSIKAVIYTFRAAEKDGIGVLRDTGIDPEQINIFQEVKI